MAVTRISRAFKDISLSFEPHPITNDLPILKNESAIRRSVRNIVQTIPTEKFFNPVFGSDVYKSLFDFVDFGTAAIIEDQILTCIKNFEPRVENTRVRVDQHLMKTHLRLQYFLISSDKSFQHKNIHSY